MGSRSAKKRHRQNVRENSANNFLQVRARTALKHARKAVADGADGAGDLARRFDSFIDRAAKRGGIHPKKAARLKSRLSIKIARASKL